VWRHFGGRGPGRFLWQHNVLAPLRRARRRMLAGTA
jgi:hypothetical protein